MTFQKTDHLRAPSQGAAAKPAANPPSAGRSSGFDPVTGANTRAGGMKFNHISDLVQHHVSRVGVETGGVVGAATKSAGIAALNMPDLATRSTSLGNSNLAKAVARASSPLNKLSTPVVSALSNAASLAPGVTPAKQAAAALEKTAETAVKDAADNAKPE